MATVNLGLGAMIAGNGLVVNGTVLSVNATQSVTVSGSTVTLVNDVPTPAASYVYGTDAAGVRGWFPATSSIAGVSGALNTTIAATGQQAWTAGQNNATNLSGSLTSASGALVSQIQSAAGVLSLNNVTGLLTLGGINGNSISVSGTTLWVSGTSGYNAAVYATAANLALTGQQAWTAANNNAINLSGNLTQTGVTLGNQITSLSGWSASIVNLQSTGSVLYADIIGLSGQAGSVYATITNLASTGQQVWTIGQNNALNLSGVLSASGRRAWDDATNLSGNLTQTGVLLRNTMTGISGALVSQIAASAAGVSTLNGLSGTLTIGGAGGGIFTSISGQTIWVSGAAGGGGPLPASLAYLTGDQVFTASVAAKTYVVSVSGVAIPLIGGSLTGTYNIDFTNSPGLQTLTVTGATLISGVNYTAGGAATLRVNVSGNNAAPLRFPAVWADGWVSDIPTGIPTGRFGILTLNTFTANDTGVALAWAVRG